MQRYDNISTYSRQLTLIKFFLYFYTFSLTHIYARTLYKAKHRQTDGPPVPNKRYIYMCYRLCCGCILAACQCKRHPKAEKQIKPIHGTKILQGRVAPPIGGCVFMGLPHIIFFLKNFFYCLYWVFFLNFFFDFCFIC